MSVNRCHFIGNVTKDPELKFTPSGDAVCNFGIACDEKFKGRDGQQQERTEFVNIVAWRKLGEICGEYLKKGTLVYLEGKLSTRSYEDRDGNKRYVTEIVADQMQMLGPKNPANDRPQNTTTRRQPVRQEPSPPETDQPFPLDDDVPF